MSLHNKEGYREPDKILLKQKNIFSINEGEKVNLDIINDNINFESAVIALLILYQENKDHISIKNSTLVINYNKKGLVSKIKDLMKILCNSPFIFYFDNLNSGYYYNFQQFQNYYYLSHNLVLHHLH